jgi:hypothetical protein
VADRRPVLAVGASGKPGRAAYHLAPKVHPDEVGIARRLGIAASAVGLPSFVFHSVLHPDDQRLPHHLREAEAERVLHDLLAGRVVVLRPAAHHQNLLAQSLAGVITVPYSLDAPCSTVDLDDVGEVAARTLLEPGREKDATHDLAGSEVLTTRPMAQGGVDGARAPGRGAPDEGGHLARGAGRHAPGRRP